MDDAQKKMLQAKRKEARERKAREDKGHLVRTRDGGSKRIKYGRKLAIFMCCTECLGWEVHPQDCTSPLCPLFPFRGRTEATQHGD